jgi:hypothetical protein
MTNNALIYRRPSKWPIAAALTAAVLIHLSAVAIAFHQGSPAILPAAADPTIIGVYSLTMRRLLQIRIFPFRPPDRFRQPILSNLRKLVARSKYSGPRSHWANRANTGSGSGKS